MAKEMTLINVDGMIIPICVDCMRDDHNHYGGEEDCKHVSKNGHIQCHCNLEWKELQVAIKGLNHGKNQSSGKVSVLQADS